jgi:hypothetical protein
MGDVSAKDGSQETLVNLSALLVSLVLTPWLADAPAAVSWLLFAVFTVLHLFCNYRAVSALSLDQFNRRRAAVAMGHWLAAADPAVALPPAAVNAAEPLFPCPGVVFTQFRTVASALSHPWGTAGRRPRVELVFGASFSATMPSCVRW